MAQQVNRPGFTFLSLGLLILVLGTAPARSATIAVGGACSLADAIVAANTDTAVGGCSAGSDADTLVLSGNVTLTTVLDVDVNGDTGLPRVVSEITVEGGDFVIERDLAAPPFRRLRRR